MRNGTRPREEKHVNNILAIALGGALGSVLRYSVSNGVHYVLPRDFPYGTLTVNTLGSLIMGLAYVLLVDRIYSGVEFRAFLTIGFLGAFTTFSTFSLETVNLIEDGNLARAFANVIGSVVLCVSATWFGIVLGRQI